MEPRNDEPEDTGAQNLIEVGAIGETIRYWRAKEAVRQGEARLAAQAAVRTALEARATGITGWSSASLLAAAVAGLSAAQWQARVGVVALSALLFACAASCIHAARPRDWTLVGYDPQVIMNDELATELEAWESIAEGLSVGIQDNNLRLNQMGRDLRLAGWLLILAPIVGALTYVIARVVRLA